MASPASGNPPEGSPRSRLSGAHFTDCPEEEYQGLLDAKVERLSSMIRHAARGLPIPSVEVFDSPRSHFRMRANFNILRDKIQPGVVPGTSLDDFFYAMFDPNVEGKRKPGCEILTFPRGTLLLNTLMDRLMQVLRQSDFRPLSSSLFEVRFVCTQTQQAVIVLIYRKPLASNWVDLATKALEQINPDKSKHIIKIIGRSHKEKAIVGSTDGSDIIEEKYTITTQCGEKREITLFQTEGAFSQPNATVCEKMLSWVCDITADASWRSRDLLELYCGGGTFTAALCKNFNAVVATEISKESVKLAEQCFERNGSSNVKVARMSSEEFETAMRGARGSEFHRLTSKNINLQKDYDFSTVFVDPPRAGLDPATCKLLTSFDNILYISCNPETLARDVQAILEAGSYTIERLAAFDQFPYTHHLESGVYLRKTAPTVDDAASLCGKRKEAPEP